MAGRVLDRRRLREQADQAEEIEDGRQDDETEAPKPKKAAKAKPAAKVRKPRAKKAPARMCARWGVFDNSMKQVAIFDYNQRAAADEKLADLLVKKKGIHFMQIVKEPMPEPISEETAALT